MEFLRRVGVLVATVLAAAAVGHVFLSATSGERFTGAVAGTPRFLVDAHRLDAIAGHVARTWPEAIDADALRQPGLWREIEAARAGLLALLAIDVP